MSRLSKVSCGALYKCPDYYCLHWKLVCDGFWDCPQGTDEASTCLVRDCTGMFSCPHSRICILASSLCDSVSDCPLSHDEIFCDVQHCPHKCDCVGYMMHCENLTERSIFYKLNLLPYFYIAIVRSKLDIHRLPFARMKEIKKIDLSANNLGDICNALFDIPTALKSFDLSQNLVKHIDKQCFDSLQVEHINVEMNNVKDIDHSAFYNQNSTISLNFDRNKIVYLHKSSFLGLHDLKHLSFLHNNLQSIDNLIFSMDSLLTVKVDSILLCCEYKEINKWCDEQNATNDHCQYAHIHDTSLTGLVFGATEFMAHLIMCCLYLKGYLQKLIHFNPYKTILIGMHINGAQYGISLVLNFLVWCKDEDKTSTYITLTEEKPSNLCVIASFFSINFMMLSAMTQILISASRYEAVKQPLFTKMKKSSFVLKIVVFLFTICSLTSASMTSFLIMAEHGYFPSFCSLVSRSEEEATITFEIALYMTFLVHIVALILVNSLYIFLLKETLSQSLRNTIDSTKRHRRLLARISCLLILNDIFWLILCILLILLRFNHIKYHWIAGYLSIMVPIQDLINIPILSKGIACKIYNPYCCVSQL